MWSVTEFEIKPKDNTTDYHGHITQLGIAALNTYPSNPSPEGTPGWCEFAQAHEPIRIPHAIDDIGLEAIAREVERVSQLIQQLAARDPIRDEYGTWLVALQWQYMQDYKVVHPFTPNDHLTPPANPVEDMEQYLTSIWRKHPHE